MTGPALPDQGWIVYGQNVLESIPRRQRTLEAIRKLDLMVVVDVMPMEQMNYADLVLPEATYLERYDAPTVVGSAKASLHRDTAAGVRPPVRIQTRMVDRETDGDTARSGGVLPLEDAGRASRDHDSSARLDGQQLLNCGAVSFPGRPYIEDRPPEDRCFDTRAARSNSTRSMLEQLGADPLPKYTPVVDPPPASFG